MKSPHPKVGEVAPCDLGARAYLLGQARILQKLAPKVMKGRHPEALHQFRVAVRRTRAVLRGLGRGLPLGEQASTSELERLGALTTLPRDLDVHRLDLEARMPLLPFELQTALAPFVEWLSAERARAQRDLVEALGSQQMQDFLQGWTTTLEEAFAPLQAQDMARKHRKALVACWKRMVHLHAGSHTGEEALHDLRKTGKRFRYLLEVPEESPHRVATQVCLEALRHLQTSLGIHQDRTVQAARLSSWRKAHVSPQDAWVRGFLITLRMEREMARREGLTAFQEFRRILQDSKLLCPRL